ncbi:MAG: ABC transporter permease subunit, partial [Candidatus Humimicrobiaceae bacterium]
AGFIFGTINGFGIAYLGIAPIIMTLAMAMAIEGILLFTTKGLIYGKTSPMLEIIGNDFLKFTIAGYTIKIPWVNIIWIILIVVAVIILNRTSIGFVIRGIGTNARAAELLGVRVKVVKLLVYSFSGMISALMGLLLLGYVGAPNISLGLGNKVNYPMMSIIAVVIGGIGGGQGSYVGAVAGSILLVTLNSILTTIGFDDGSRMTVAGLFLLILLILYTRRTGNTKV